MAVSRSARRLLCLDWDRRSLRIVVARTGGGKATLEDAHSHHLPNSVDAEDPQSLGEFIKQMLRRHHITLKQVAVDVPRERAVINRLSLPPTPREEVAAAVRFQAMKELPFPVDSAALDFVIMGENDEGLATEVLLAAVTKATLDKIRETCEAASLTPTRIGLRPYANLVSAQRVHPDPNAQVLFVDVGPGATEIDVMRGETLAFARSANVNIPAPPSYDSETNHDEGSRVISLADLEGSGNALENAVNDLLVEVTRTLQAFRATETDVAIDQVIVAGGTGVETQLSDLLHRRMNYPVELFDPTRALDVPSEDATKLRSFSAALGLAWGASRTDLALDFLNPKRSISAREILQRRLRIGGIAAALVITASAAGLATWYHRLDGEQKALTAVNDKLWTEVQEKRKVENKIGEVGEWTHDAIWIEELRRLTDLAVQPGKQMVVREIEMETVSRRPSITLRHVFVTDWQVAGEFVNALADVAKGKYAAAQGTWMQLANALRWKGRTDVRIDLVDIQKFRSGAKTRERQRRDALNDRP